MGTTRKPTAAVLYCRISDARNGDCAGVHDQEADLRAHAGKLGWGILEPPIVENDTSAFKRRQVTLPNGDKAMRVVRPGWRAMLDDLATGRADGLLALDLDRAARDPRDLEDLIDVVEGRLPRIPVESITGSLKLGNDADVTMARIMVAVANKSSRDTARRVTRAMLRVAGEGRFTGGSRPFGHDVDGTVREDEAGEIRKAAEAVLSGVGLRGVVRELNTREVPTRRGGRWTSQSLRGLLLQPRLAGLMAYDGEILDGVTPLWQPILERDQWEAVRAVLNNPERRTSPGPTPKWLGSCLYRCGHPDHIDADPPVTMVHGSSGAGVAVYKCSQGQHVIRVGAPLDAHVEAVIVERLSRPDAVDLLAPRAQVDIAALAGEANALRARIVEAGDLWEDGTLTAAQFRARKARLVDKLEAVEATMAAGSGSTPLTGLAGRPDAGAVWAGLDLARRRAVLDTLMTVTVLPAIRRGRGFDEATVRIEPRDHPDDTTV
jgi:site-specific DNA recombinase